MTTPYRQLTQDQRHQIEAGLRAKESQASIAKQVGVHPSTISRNSLKTIYKAVSATHDRADAWVPVNFASRLPG